MQKISRIYVGNYGVKLAWYDGQLFDLRDPDTEEATDTIINLENGGGKTTLLSFILSCFEPRQDKWLKHLVDLQGHGHFHEYFSDDGLPATCVIEWQMPPRSAKGEPYLLVMGQVVSVHAAADRPNIDRLFFAFEARDGLSLESLPVPKLAKKPAMTFGEIRRWLREAQDAHADVQYFEGLEAWQRHLRDERLLDLDMLRMQVQFSATEGGFDKGFLGFKTEEEFLRKLLGLTLNEERAAAVREAVVQACEKLRRKPQFERRLAELKKLEGVLAHFTNSANALAQAEAEQATYANTAGQLALALQSRDNEQRARAEKANAEAVEQERIEAERHGQYQTAIIDHQGLELLQQQLTVRVKEKARHAAESAFNAAELEIRHLQAAQALAKLHGLIEQDKALTAREEKAQQGLKPQRADAAHAGSLLRYSLRQEENRARAQAKVQEERERKAQKATETLGGTLQALEREDNDVIKETARLTEAQRAYAEGYKRLAQHGLVNADTSETALEAAERVGQSIGTLKAAQAGLLLEQTEFVAQEKKHREAHVAAKVEAERFTGLARERTAYLAKAFSARERLEQDTVLHRALQADIADPDSPAVLAGLERYIRATEKELDGFTLRIAELQDKHQAILDTGLSERSSDVARVVEHLAEMGLKSARAFNGYLAEVEPDAERAKTIVVSNPARFLGVAVASGELDSARGILAAAPHLSRPVMVSELARDPDSPAANGFVVPADDHAAYNFAAAEALARSIAELIASEQSKQTQSQERHKSALATQARLNAYLEEYGSVRMAQANTDLDKAKSKASTAIQYAEEEQQLADSCQNQAQTKGKEANGKGEAIVRAQRDEQRLRQFHEDHESGAAERNVRLAALAEKQKAIFEKKTQARTEQQSQQEQKDDALQNKLKLIQEAQKLSEEWATVLYYDNAHPAAKELSDKPQTTDTLRVLYQTAKETFEAKEKDVLGVLQSQLAHVRRSRAEAQTTYDKNFSGVPGGEARKRMGLNIDSALEHAAVVRKKAEGDRQSRITEHEVAKRDADRYAAEHPEASRYDEAALAKATATAQSTLAALPAQIRSAQGKAAQLLKEETAAGEAAQRARREAKAASSAAQDANRARETLKSALSPAELPTGAPTALQDDVFKQVQALVSEHKESKKRLDGATTKARNAFERLKTAASAPAFMEAEPEMAQHLTRNDFDAGCANRDRIAAGLTDRIRTTDDNLNAMQADFESVVGELYTLSADGVSILNSATSAKNRVPEGAPYVGGKAVLKMRGQLSAVSVDARKEALRSYLGTLIDTGQVPQKGSDLVAVAILRMHGRTLGLQILRMVRDEAHQYVLVSEIPNSGGEGVTMAMFLYILINKLRAEQQAHVHKVGGGPLILDNPFAKATSVPLLRVQRQFATAAGLQLIFATALSDYNSLGEFQRFIRLRHAGRNSKTGRNHIEMVDFQLTEPNEVVNG